MWQREASFGLTTAHCPTPSQCLAATSGGNLSMNHESLGSSGLMQHSGPEDCRIAGLLHCFTRVLGAKTQTGTSSQLIKHLNNALHAIEAAGDDMPSAKRMRLDLPDPLQLLRSMQQQQQQHASKLLGKHCRHVQHKDQEQLLQGQQRLLQLHTHATSEARSMLVAQGTSGVTSAAAGVAAADEFAAAASTAAAPTAAAAAIQLVDQTKAPTAAEAVQVAQPGNISKDSSAGAPVQPISSTPAEASISSQGTTPPSTSMPTNSSRLLRKKLAVLRKKAKQTSLRGRSFATIAAFATAPTATPMAPPLGLEGQPAAASCVIAQADTTTHAAASLSTPTSTTAPVTAQANTHAPAAEAPSVVVAAATAAPPVIVSEKHQHLMQQKQLGGQHVMVLIPEAAALNPETSAKLGAGAASASNPANTRSAHANIPAAKCSDQAAGDKKHSAICAANFALSATAASAKHAGCTTAAGAQPTEAEAVVAPTAAAAAGPTAAPVALIDEQQQHLQRLIGSKRQLLQQRPAEALAQLRRAFAMYAPRNSAAAGGNQDSGSSCSAVHVAPQLLAAKALAAAGLQCIVRAKLQAAATAAGDKRKGGIAVTDAELLQVKQQLLSTAFGVDSSRCQGILDWHKAEAAEHQKRREAAAAARLSALRNASLPEYLDMLKKAKNGRLQEVLGQTDACLRQLAEKLASKGRTMDPLGSGHAAVAAAPGSCTDQPAAVAGSRGDEGVLDSSNAWTRLAAQLPADIATQPKMLTGGGLREYQMQGLRWLVGLTKKGFNGILADDMGLGKTVQVIAMVCHCVEAQQCSLPFLIVCPASVTSNWAGELQRWAPGLKAVEYRGSADTRDYIYRKQVRRKCFNVLLTTYELLMSDLDRSRLIKIKWAAIVVDEGHRLKNAECKLAQQLRGYSSNSRLLLTGTPLQNKLTELWSLLNFLMPDVFSSADDFNSWFGAPLEAIKSAGSVAAAAAGSAAEASMFNHEEYLLVTNRLHAVLRPFMLRRLKESVATELPQKNEIVLRCQLGAYQSALYELVKSRLRDEDGSAGVKGINNTVMELRNICNHPLLSKLHPEFGEDLVQDRSNSSSKLPAVLRLSCKVDMLDQVLVRLAAGGHKVLLFCTMTRLLDLLEEYCEWRGWEWCRLDGTTGGQERAEAIERFNNPDSGVFLFMLSLRAGGVGLNLQAADTVIMYDSDWNPQIDLQAQARAHRIGQKREVLVVRLLVERSIEEHILQVAEQKRKFADSSITGGFFDGKTAAEDRRKYLLSILSSETPGSSNKGTDAATAGAAESSGSTLAANAPAARCASTLTARKLNELIARGPEELRQLQEREERLAALQAWQQLEQQQQAGLARERAGLTQAAVVAEAMAPNAAAIPAAVEPWDTPLCRLAADSDCAELIAAAREAAAPKPKEDLSLYGRGVKRAAVTAGNLTSSGAADASGEGMTVIRGATAVVAGALHSAAAAAGRRARAAAAGGRATGSAAVAASSAAAGGQSKHSRVRQAATAAADGQAEKTASSAGRRGSTGDPAQQAAAAVAGSQSAKAAGTTAAQPPSALPAAVEAESSFGVTAADVAASALHSTLKTDLQQRKQQQPQVPEHMTAAVANQQAFAAQTSTDAEQHQSHEHSPSKKTFVEPGSALETYIKQYKEQQQTGVAAADSAVVTSVAQTPDATAAAAVASDGGIKRGTRGAAGQQQQPAHVISVQAGSILVSRTPRHIAAAGSNGSKQYTRGTEGQRQKKLEHVAAAAAALAAEVANGAVPQMTQDTAAAAAGGESGGRHITRGTVGRQQQPAVTPSPPAATGDVVRTTRAAAGSSCSSKRARRATAEQQQQPSAAAGATAPDFDDGVAMPGRINSAKTTVAAATGAGVGSGGSSSSSSRVLVCCGTAQGWYCAEQDRVQLAVQHQQQSPQQQLQPGVGHWLLKSVFTKLGRGAAGGNPNRLIRIVQANGEPGPALELYLRQLQQQQKELAAAMAGSSTPAAAATGDHSTPAAGRQVAAAEAAAAEATAAEAAAATEVVPAVVHNTSSKAAVRPAAAAAEGRWHEGPATAAMLAADFAAVPMTAEQQQALLSTGSRSTAPWRVVRVPKHDLPAGYIMLEMQFKKQSNFMFYAPDGKLFRCKCDMLAQASHHKLQQPPLEAAQVATADIEEAGPAAPPSMTASASAGAWFDGPITAADLATDLTAVSMAAAQQQALLSRRSRSSGSWRVVHAPKCELPAGYVAIEVQIGKAHLHIFYAPDGKLLKCKSEMLAHAQACKQQQQVETGVEAEAPRKPAAGAASRVPATAGIRSIGAAAAACGLPGAGCKPQVRLQPGGSSSSDAETAGAGRAGGEGSSCSSQDARGRVRVRCGTASGWYCPDRDEVLFEQQQRCPPKQQQQEGLCTTQQHKGSLKSQQQQWFSKGAFMKLGGEGHKHDASKAIKLVLDHGQQGSTLATYSRNYKQLAKAAVHDSLETLADAAAAAAARSRSSSHDAAACGSETLSEDVITAAGSLVTMRASPPADTGSSAVQAAQGDTSAAAAHAAAGSTSGIAGKMLRKRQSSSTADSSYTERLRDSRKLSKVAAAAPDMPPDAKDVALGALRVDAAAVFDAAWIVGQQLRCQTVDVPVLGASDCQLDLPKLPGGSLAAIFEHLWQK